MMKENFEMYTQKILAVAAMARKIKQNYPDEEQMNIVFGVDGSLYKHHPVFSKIVSEKTNELCKDFGVTVRLIKSKEPSARGAAIVAAVTERLKKAKVSDLLFVKKLCTAGHLFDCKTYAYGLEILTSLFAKLHLFN